MLHQNIGLFKTKLVQKRENSPKQFENLSILANFGYIL
jgi:hypothetical protein